jgi:hypothetical protein
VLIALIALTIALSGVRATDGPLQVAPPAARPEHLLRRDRCDLCALVGMVTGNSWTTAGTLGAPFVGMGTAAGSKAAAPRQALPLALARRPGRLAR